MGNCFCFKTEKKELGKGSAGCVKMCCGVDGQKEVEVIYQKVTRGYDMDI